MTITAENNCWLNKGRLLTDDHDKQLFQNMKVAFQTDKGNNHLVPVFVCQDPVTAIQSQVRDASSVRMETGTCSPRCRTLKAMSAAGMP